MNSMTSTVDQAYDPFRVAASVSDALFAIVEFDVTGKILHANDRFLSLMGYCDTEIIGKQQSMFLPDDVNTGPEHDMCWTDLRAGKSRQAILPRITKTGQRIWIEATYAPVRNPKGDVVKIVKFATDVTERQETLVDLRGKVNAIEHSHAVVEFDLGGNILTANHHFLCVMGYQLSEIVGCHHSMFVGPKVAKSADYRAFWRSLCNGNHRARQFKRFTKDGSEVWFEATYNPILDGDGAVCKIVKFAVDITDQVRMLTDLKATLDTSLLDVDHGLGVLDQYSEENNLSCTQARAHLEVSSMVAGRLVNCAAETSDRMRGLRSVADHVFDTATEGAVAAAALEDVVDVVQEITCEFSDVARQIETLQERTMKRGALEQDGKGGDAAFADLLDELAKLSVRMNAACQQMTAQGEILKDRVDENTFKSGRIRSDLKAMLSSVAVASMSVERQSGITSQVSSEMHGIQTALEASCDLSAKTQQVSRQVGDVIGWVREASAVLAR
ncbi:PAS domain-containing methyl-accepting chemotaxis protein [Thalassospira lohafexi]|uniref:Chemotaxis protein n=1 Tax=Thalassospira lohafexi TaxID=744227 RepID=A0A2N3LBE2_9PROT|nr:PAS domain-containing methyl-accepting chemotaxis protein [Thalassospira lohafexi]PKR60145.1 chemotaxis protein [Thalassospira lohafexi]